MLSDLVTSGWILYVETISYKNQASVSEVLEYLLDGMIVYAVEDRKRKAVMLVNLLILNW